ncbi:MAG: bifunctional methylenetetrahydrofolate dehydrogenase/methenyltetrahydrofolate cyclohydrolase FolD [Myxococcales bacterium]|nr:bifunctional methylenetetrahydrofolate dehydrogenase/methenyltetrahydrofolate cyclohydrolase FolD [Myxococcales bacterium]
MSARILSGTEIAAQVRAELSGRAEALATTLGRPPGLAVVLVGDNPASRSYVTGKRKACNEIGVRTFDFDLPAATSMDELRSLLERLNSDGAVDGILVQLPLPAHLDERAAIEHIRPEKDVDGIHPENAGRLLRGEDGFVPCTPLGVVELLRRSHISTRGAHVVIVGRGQLVGRPLSCLMLRKGEGGDATVTVCHSATPDLARFTRDADILVAAAGRPRVVTAHMVREGAVVIDVGVNRVGTTASGKARLCGDVDFAPVAEKAAAITPVPGGVGPMTIAMLLSNTLRAAERARSSTPT